LLLLRLLLLLLLLLHLLLYLLLLRLLLRLECRLLLQCCCLRRLRRLQLPCLFRLLRSLLLLLRH
jgi:hypothetical protein